MKNGVSRGEQFPRHLQLLINLLQIDACTSQLRIAGIINERSRVFLEGNSRGIIIAGNTSVHPTSAHHIRIPLELRLFV
jgi:hypothetical protein